MRISCGPLQCAFCTTYTCGWDIGRNTHRLPGHYTFVFSLCSFVAWSAIYWSWYSVDLTVSLKYSVISKSIAFVLLFLWQLTEFFCHNWNGTQAKLRSKLVRCNLCKWQDLYYDFWSNHGFPSMITLLSFFRC